MTEATETPKTTARKSRKSETLRRENAGEATVNTQAASETTIAAPTDSTQAPATPATTTNIVLVDSSLTQMTHGWGKQETKDAREVVLYAMNQMVGKAESAMSIGERFNKFAEKHGDKVNILIKETAKLGIAGLTESNIQLWRIRARELPKYFPNAHVRKYVLLLSGGEGVIVRDESFNEKDSDGKPKPKPYILSPFWQEAIKTIGPVPAESTAPNAEEIGELYARKTAQHSSFLRTKARTSPEDARIKKQFAAFQKRTIGWLSKHESLVYQCLSKMLVGVVKETTDLNLALALAGTLDKATDGEQETAEQTGKTKAA